MKYINIFFLLLLCYACNNTPIIEVDNDNDNELDERLLNANKYISRSEQTQIDGFVARNGWDMTTLSSGVRIQEHSIGSGRKIDYEDTVTIRYTIETITGIVIYKDVEETLVIGHNNTIIGLDAALRSLHFGSHARLIIPSDMAYGIVGDGDRIPSRTVLYYQLEIDNMER